MNERKILRINLNVQTVNFTDEALLLSVVGPKENEQVMVTIQPTDNWLVDDFFNEWLPEQGLELLDWQKQAAKLILSQRQAAGKTFLINLLHRYENEPFGDDESEAFDRE